MQRTAIEPEMMLELSTPRPWRWLSGVLFDWACIISVLVLVWLTFHPLVILLAIVVIGNRQHALSIMAHDGGHFLAAKNKWLNDFLTVTFAFYPLSIGLSGYRKFHFAHHSFMGTENDPEFPSKKLDTPFWDLPTTPHNIFWLAIKDLSGLNIRTLWHLIQTFPRVTPMDFIGPVLWWTIVGGILLSFHLWWVIALWIIATATSFLACFHLRVWTEHVGTTSVHRISPLWWQRLIFLPHNTWCHYEHHEWPTIPYWRLPKSRSLDNHEPIHSLEGVFESFRTAPTTPSGALMKNHQ
ncbi:MAG: fatty acid desaturase [Candidatus Moranbacteria bacterium]|nr:fatty acid desaturase [Candidatus Moranbacteria bacterium]